MPSGAEFIPTGTYTGNLLKPVLKSAAHFICLLAALPAAILSGFGRFYPVFVMFAQACALAPGLPGDYLRGAYYKLTLLECSLTSRISFGTFFAHRETWVGPMVYIGSYCVLGKTSIGERTQIASGVQILSGREQARDADKVAIGADCWIGAAAVVMADVGPGSTIGAGSVVTRPIPAGSVAVGSPAKVIS